MKLYSCKTVARLANKGTRSGGALRWGRSKCYELVEQQEADRNCEIRKDVTTTENPACTAACTSFADLARIVTAWPRLPQPIRRAMLALIQSAGMLFGPAMLAAWPLG
jgi:hypothetical protein